MSAKNVSGHEARLAWLKSLECGDSVLVYRPTYSHSALFYRPARSDASLQLHRPKVVATGTVTSKNRASLSIQWRDGDIDRLTRVKRSGYAAGSVENSCRSDHHDYGFCIFPDEDHLQEYISVKSIVADMLRSSHAISTTMNTRYLKIGSTVQEMENIIAAWNICFS